MKKTTRIIVAGVTLLITIVSCNNASKKDMSDASKNIKEANTDMKEAVVTSNDSAKAALISGWKTFKNESDTAIAGMERETTALETKINKANSREKGKLKTDLINLKEKLNRLKIRLAEKNIEFENDIKNFNTSVVSKNESFEREFKHDMNELGAAFKDLFKDNVK